MRCNFNNIMSVFSDCCTEAPHFAHYSIYKRFKYDHNMCSLFFQRTVFLSEWKKLKQRKYWDYFPVIFILCRLIQRARLKPLVG